MNKGTGRQQALMPAYERFDIAFARGEGAWLTATDGRRYLDFGAGIAVAVLGHCHPHIVEALKVQGSRLWHCSNLYHIPEQERLADRLTDASFADRAFFCNSGAEAVECTLKLVRKFQNTAGRAERYRVITCENSFHGRTMATIAAGGSAKHCDGFEPIMEGFDHVPFADLPAIEAAIGKETAAILVEPVQGEGGVRPAPAEYLQGLRSLADRHGLLLAFDEVQCGVGRTGRLFAHEWAGVTPDVMAIAKGLGGGFPIGCCLATKAVGEAMTAGSHGSTFGGNPLAMAVANSVLDVVLAKGFLSRVAEMGALLRKRIDALAGSVPTVISEVRGTGLMLGLKCIVPNRKLIDRLHAAGLLCVPAGDNVVRLLPPLIIGEEEIEAAMRALMVACNDLVHEAA
ncbi:MAG: aspartate aminotransferase family protein [Rhodospirillales bacterium]